MIRKLLPLLVGSLAFAVTAPPAHAQVSANCSQTIVQSALLSTYHLFPGDPYLFLGPLFISNVSGGTWSGYLTTNTRYNEPVNGTISGSTFSLRRSAGAQTWRATCSPTGIAGSIKKIEDSVNTGAFLIKPY